MGVAASEPPNSKHITPHQLENAAKTGQYGVRGEENKALQDATWQAACCHMAAVHTCSTVTTCQQVAGQQVAGQQQCPQSNVGVGGAQRT